MNEENGTRKLVTHKVMVNEFISCELKIPEVLEASELEGLMRMSKQLVNIDSSLYGEKSYKPKHATTYTAGSGKTGLKYQIWTQEQMNVIISNYDGRKSNADNIRTLYKNLNGVFTKKKIEKKIYSMQKAGMLEAGKLQRLKENVRLGVTPKSKSMRGKKNMWTESELEAIKTTYNPKLGIAENSRNIFDKFKHSDKTLTQLKDRLKNAKSRGDL